MTRTAADFLKDVGMDEPFGPGQIKYKKHVGEKPSTSYTMVYDWKTNPKIIRVEVRPGLTGEFPDKKELSKYAIWLQSVNYLEFDMSGSTQH